MLLSKLVISIKSASTECTYVLKVGGDQVNHIVSQRSKKSVKKS